MLALLLSAAAGYLLGSIPSGLIAGKIRGVDIRQHGSGNIGATNVVRTLGKKWGYAVFASDFFKGVAAVLFSRAVCLALQTPPELPALFAAVGAILGHNFPVWLGFKGGKGIATSAGVIVALFPWPVFVCAILAWVAIFFTTRYVSVASIIAALVLPASLGVLWGMGRTSGLYFGVGIVLCALAIWRHKVNIQRLVAGTEPRFERKKNHIDPMPS